MGGAHDDGFQRRGGLYSHLPLDDGAERLADHADLATAPGLCGNPTDHFTGVLLFLEVVDVGVPSRRIACAPGIKLDRDVTTLDEVGHRGRVFIPVVRQRLAETPIGVVFHDGRKAPGVVGSRYLGADFHSVAHRHTQIVDPYTIAELGSHGLFSRFNNGQDDV